MSCSLDRNGAANWGAQHQYAAMRFFDATQDYIAARCCILNGLHAGFILASQAVEKLLKAIIYLESTEKIKGHNPYELKERLKKSKDYNLDNFDLMLKKLHDHYLSRYYEDSPSVGASSEELPLIDELWFTLTEKLPMPDEVKYRTMFFTELLDPNPYWLNGFWLTKDNLSFDKRKKILSRKYIKVRKHLYGK